MNRRIVRAVTTLLVLTLAIGCAWSSYRDDVLRPGMYSIWTAEFGLADEAAYGGATPQDLAEFTTALEIGNLEVVQALWPIMLGACKRGIQDRLISGEIGPNGALIATDLLGEFDLNIIHLLDLVE